MFTHPFHAFVTITWSNKSEGAVHAVSDHNAQCRLLTVSKAAVRYQFITNDYTVNTNNEWLEVL